MEYAIGICNGIEGAVPIRQIGGVGAQAPDMGKGSPANHELLQIGVQAINLTSVVARKRPSNPKRTAAYYKYLLGS